jgi:uncharacterized protein YoxC
MKNQLLDSKKNFIYGFEETLVNFKKTMEIMDRQAEVMNRFTEDINVFDKKAKIKNDDGQQKKAKVPVKKGDSVYM